jgi:rfaE bifunctional protein kinase chain/domain
MMTRQTFDKGTLREAVTRLSGSSVLVLGDLFLDEYIVGRATRLSREAPVPVLEFDRRFYVPGGAANPAHNISALGSRAYQIGVVGDDESGLKLANHLTQAGISTDGLVVDPSRPTTTKTRVVAEGTLVFPQQVARIDLVERHRLEAGVVSQVVANLKSAGPRAGAVLISDYKGGVVNEETTAAALRVAREQEILITADSQGDLLKFKGFDVVKCNRREAQAAMASELQNDVDIEGAGRRILSDLEVSNVMITRGSEGMSLITVDGEALHIPAANRSEVFDVTGAGDTVIAVTTLGLAAGLGITESAHLANLAAGLVVRKLGNAAPTVEELAWAIEHWPEPDL